MNWGQLDWPFVLASGLQIGVAAELVRVAPVVGDRVEARYQGGQPWFPGVVSAVMSLTPNPNPNPNPRRPALVPRRRERGLVPDP